MTQHDHHKRNNFRIKCFLKKKFQVTPCLWLKFNSLNFVFETAIASVRRRPTVFKTSLHPPHPIQRMQQHLALVRIP